MPDFSARDRPPISLRRRKLVGLLALGGSSTSVLAQSITSPSSTSPALSVAHHPSLVTAESSPIPATPVARHPSHVTRFAPVLPGYRLSFPRDEGSHPDFRTEWWYITGWLRTSRASTSARPRDIGFQITFFRSRMEIDERNPSAFAPRQILIAHAAISDAKRSALAHDQKVARGVLGLAGADEGLTRVWIGDWSLEQRSSAYVANIPGGDFGMELTFSPTQPPLMQGEDGLSRKGPREESASYYYSFPHLRVLGTLREKDGSNSVSGTAWLDHEWSSSYMDERASGWDWIGINLDDGGAIMAFRMRDTDGRKFWAAATYRAGNGMRQTYTQREVDFVPLRTWRSPRSGALYPIACRIDVPGLSLTIEPLMQDQEQDVRLSAGTFYWEGAVTALRDGEPAGRGYLELTGYWRAMRGLTEEKAGAGAAPRTDK